LTTTEPKIEHRPKQNYVGIRTQVSLQDLGSGIIPQLHSEVMGWLKSQDMEPSGASFIRYHVVNMPDYLDIELAWPVAQPVTGSGRVQAGVLPEGQYAFLIYTDVSKGTEGTGVLIDWAEANGIQWDRWDDEKGDGFRARYETFLTEPDDEPDQSKWEVEVAIKLAD
jgi:hypothetical protein